VLFRFYHQESIKGVHEEEGSSRKDLSDQRNIIANYIKTVDTILTSYAAPGSDEEELASLSSKQQELQEMLQSLLLAAGLEKHGHIAGLILISLAKGVVTTPDGQTVDAPLLRYARQLLVLATERAGTLHSIQNLLLTLVALPLSQTQGEYTDGKFKIISPTLVEQAMEERAWLLSTSLLSGGAKGLRQLKFMILFVLENLLTSDAEMKSVLATIAGGDPSEEVQEQFLNCYLLLGIMKDGLSNFLSDKEYKGESESGQAKASTKRLSKRVQGLLEALN